MSNDTKWHQAWAESIARTFAKGISSECMGELELEIVHAMEQAAQKEARRHLAVNIIASNNQQTFQSGYHRGYTAGLQDGYEAAAKETEPYAKGALHPQTLFLVQRFAEAMAEKLSAAEQKYGYTNEWARDDWMDECRQKLRGHVEKGDPRDVAAYCAFLWHHGEPTNAAE